MTAFQRWLSYFAGTVLAVVITYQWVDRPVSLFAHDNLAQYRIFVRLTYIPEPFIPAAALVFLGLGLWLIAKRTLPRCAATVLICSISLMAAESTKNQLKYVFGRFWPETWVQNNPSFIRDGAYGFNFLHGGPGYASFPSGHLAVTCAVVSVLWICYPKFWPLYILPVVAVSVGLGGANYHFVSDMIAGGFIGVTTGWIATAIWNRAVAPAA